MEAITASPAEQRLSQASEWLVRLRGDDVGDELRGDFALWLAAHPDNAAAFDRISDLWLDLDVVNRLPLAEERKPRIPAFAAGLAMAACLLVAVLLVINPGSGSVELLHLQTALGEQRTEVLSDGTQVVLNTDTTLLVRMGPQQRELELLSGEAYFDVVSNAQRPFVVTIGDATVTAIGTAFNIYRAQQRSEVTVTEGVVRVTEVTVSSARAANTELLYANQQLTLARDGLQAVASVTPEQVLAWQRHELIAEGMSLAALAGELRRYHDIHVLITDPDVAALTISGVFDLRQPQAILAALESSLDLSVETLDAGTLRLLKHSR